MMTDKEVIEDLQDRVHILEEVVGHMILNNAELADILEGMGGM